MKVEVSNGELLDKLSILELKLKNIKDDKFIFGFTENYNEFIDLCCVTNNWIPKYQTTNKTKNKKEIIEEDKNKLEDLLSGEIKFYEEALKIYNEKYKNIIK